MNSMVILNKSEEKAVQKLVINELKVYRALRVRIDNQREQIEYGVSLFPSLKKEGEINNINTNDELKVKQIERAITQGLDELERVIIEQKFLSTVEMNDMNIYLEYGIKKGKYYEKKRSALFRLATIIGII